MKTQLILFVLLTTIYATCTPADDSADANCRVCKGTACVACHPTSWLEEAGTCAKITSAESACWNTDVAECAGNCEFVTDAAACTATANIADCSKITDCIECDGTTPTKCVKCNTGKLLSVAQDACSDACGNGEMSNKDTTPVCIADCSTLNSDAGCAATEVCVPNGTKDAGECVADDCMADAALNCATCKANPDHKKCATCKDDTFVYDDTAGTCTASSTVTSDDRKNATVPAAGEGCDAAAEACLTCDETTTTECKTCADGYKLDDTAKTCKDTCADGYAMNASSACVDCPACATEGEVCSVEADGATKCAAPAAESSGLLLSAIALISAIVLA